jgi:hypothetical protein
LGYPCLACVILSLFLSLSLFSLLSPRAEKVEFKLMPPPHPPNKKNFYLYKFKLIKHLQRRKNWEK